MPPAAPAPRPATWPSGSASTGVPFIKRVVGLPGDRLSIQDGHVIRNGVEEHDPYIVPCGGGGACNFPQTITVPRGDYYMMGDNRPDSEDSRYWGPVPKSVDHRQGVLHLLAARPGRLPLMAEARRRRRARRSSRSSSSCSRSRSPSGSRC